MAIAPDRWVDPDDDLREKIQETDRKIADGSIWDDVWTEERARQEIQRIAERRERTR